MNNELIFDFLYLLKQLKIGRMVDGNMVRSMKWLHSGHEAVLKALSTYRASRTKNV
jgi:hypothetical protein